jgi:hypothetical protein
MRLIVLLAFVMGMPGSAPAQQETDPEYWVSQKAAADAEHAALQKNYAELDRQLKADPKKAVREQLEAVRRSEASLKQTRKELEGLVDPYLARALDFIVRALRDEAQARSRDMESADRKAAEQQQGLRHSVCDPGHHRGAYREASRRGSPEPQSSGVELSTGLDRHGGIAGPASPARVGLGRPNWDRRHRS